MRKILEFSVLGFPAVPWSVPNFGSGTSKSGKRFTFSRRNKKSKPHEFSMSLEDWQAYVARHAVDAMGKFGIAASILSPVILKIQFLFQTPPGRKHGEIWYGGCDLSVSSGKYVKLDPHEPDLTNLTKAVEDALEGTVIADDVQVVGHITVKLYDSTPGIRVFVYGDLEDEFKGTGNPVPFPRENHPVRRRAKPCKVDPGQISRLPDPESQSQKTNTPCSLPSEEGMTSLPLSKRLLALRKNESSPSGRS